ncbi:MAG: FAD binding domain-containing protein [Deltaproteobacteria bacterium]|nr:FAD binding domain-containing protein [Deltaproteobacteria bacterium]
MLRLRPLTLHRPTSLAEAIALKSEYGTDATYFAGGTDLLPNLKLLQVDAQVLIALADVAELRGIEAVDDDGGSTLHLGAATRLSTLAADPVVRSLVPSLADAAGRVASPQVRNMATLGGNLCLDTRCRYINQSQLFRDALGGCLKSHGKECHVVPGGQGCVAALSTDTAPLLIALGAELDLLGPDGPRSVPLGRFYSTDGLAHTDLRPGEIVVRVRVPVPAASTHVRNRKWAVRKSIDFPLVAVAVRLDLDPAAPVLTGGRIVVGVLGPRPRQLPLDRFAGASIDEALALQLGDLAFDRSRPLPNVPYDADYRRERLRVEVRRAVRDIAASLEG